MDDVPLTGDEPAIKTSNNRFFSPAAGGSSSSSQLLEASAPLWAGGSVGR